MNRYAVALSKAFNPEQPREDGSPRWSSGGGADSSAWAAGKAAFHRTASQNARRRASVYQANGDHKKTLRALRTAAYHAKKADHHDELARLRRLEEHRG